MTERDDASQQPVENQVNIQHRLSKAFRLEDREWNTVSRRIATRVIAGGGALLAFFSTGVVGFRSAYADKIFPRTYIGDVNVGGMTPKQAEAAVMLRAQQLDTSSVRYEYEDHIWTPTLAELGIGVKAADCVQQAMALGRDEKAADRLKFTTSLAEESHVIPMQFNVNPNALDAWFERVDSDIDRRAINARFTISGDQLSVTEDSTGTGVNREAVTDRIYETLHTLAPIDDKLPVTIDYPQITKADLEAHKGDVLRVLGNSVTVRFEGDRWELLPEDVSEFMIFTSTVENGTPVTQVDFDRSELSSYLRNRFSDVTNKMPVDARVQFYNGNLTITHKETNGTTMKATEFANMVADSFLGEHTRVDIPVLVTPALVREDNLHELGIKDRLCRVNSNFQRDAGTDRAHNVEVGIRLINNVIVAPGKEFSFNDAVGAIDNNPDFVGGGAIVQGVIQEEFGGGICQVTTTAFRAAIYAGLPITEWHPHSYRLRGYELDNWGAGFDASILQPWWQKPYQWADFKFQNNTDHYILVSSWSDNGIHVVEIYGTDPGWKVDVSDTISWEYVPSDHELEPVWVVDPAVGPGVNYPTAWPLDGAAYSFNRTVYDAKGEKMYTRDFTSQYRARGWQCTCSADMKGIPCW